MNSSGKGNIGVAMAIADLTKKGHSIFLPIGDNLPFDLIAYKDGRCRRLQAKYSKNGTLHNVRAFTSQGRLQTRKYSDDDFDYYSLYLPDLDIVVYPSIAFQGCTIATNPRESPRSFYWHEDFLDFTDTAQKRNREDFGYQYKYKPRQKGRKVDRPTKEELERLLWEKPTVEIALAFGVSDQAVSKWAKYYNIEKPPRGYWTGKQIA